MNLDMSFTLCHPDLMQNDSLSLALSYHESFYQAIITRELQSTSIPLSRSLNVVLLEQSGGCVFVWEEVHAVWVIWDDF